ncbi:MAG TPA: hypothetical protein VL495_02085 [Edaphobacter sp.]|jgi:hypothetical protein|nr:hypothetical protein [Edaphobacter sp.]
MNRLQSLRPFLTPAAALAVTLSFSAGCNKHVDNTPHYIEAINNYYAGHPACLWDDDMKFPVQANTSDASKTAPYDALVDQGLLVRTTDEKKVMIIASKQVNNYDLSEKGRAAWVADPDRPGFGNFCYGHRKVSGIDSATPTDGQRGSSTTVAYHYTIADPAAWATAQETQTAYPKIQQDLSGPHSATAVLLSTDEGWKVARPSTTAPATPPPAQ